MIALTLLDRRTSERFTVIVCEGWKPDATIYDVVRRAVLPARLDRSAPLIRASGLNTSGPRFRSLFAGADLRVEVTGTRRVNRSGGFFLSGVLKYRLHGPVPRLRRAR